MKKLFSIGLLSAAAMLASCRPPALYLVDPPGTQEYKLGWEDGCDTGITSQTGMTYKMTYGFKKRPEWSDNDLYKSGWNDGFTYCRLSLDPVDKSSWAN